MQNNKHFTYQFVVKGFNEKNVRFARVSVGEGD